VSVNGTLVEDKMRRFRGEFSHFSLNKCPIYTHDGASDKFSTNSHETDYSAADPVIIFCSPLFIQQGSFADHWATMADGKKTKQGRALSLEFSLFVFFLDGRTFM
jgi:hypothetical protein